MFQFSHLEQKAPVLRGQLLAANNEIGACVAFA